VLVLDMIEILPRLGKYKYGTWRVLLVKCYIDNFVHLRRCIRNINASNHNLSQLCHRPITYFGITYYPRFKVGLGEVDLKWKPFSTNGWGWIVKIFFFRWETMRKEKRSQGK
jgi:hypothetical protein